MPKRVPKQEALTVRRFISEVLVDQLLIPHANIVNDTRFAAQTGSKRPDLLIADIPYDLHTKNDSEFIASLLGYAEAKDNCAIDDADWKDAHKQGMVKAPKLGLPYFIVTNCKASIFYNAADGEELALNGNPIREFQSLDVLRMIKLRLQVDQTLHDLSTTIDTQAAITEAIFNKKLWELANIYRGINFANISEKIDFTIGFVALKVFEEKADQDKAKIATEDYWSDLKADIKANKLQRFVEHLAAYIKRLAAQTSFKEFKQLMNVVSSKITELDDAGHHVIRAKIIQDIYEVIESIGTLHDSGFDLFGAVYEKFASNKEKSDFGEFFTRRHYAHVLARLLLQDELVYRKRKEFRLVDPACGTGGFLTEAYKVLQANYKDSGTLDLDAKQFLQERCIVGFDIKQENVSRTKLNMFLVGDGHTNILRKDSLAKRFDSKKYEYILMNPPYGDGTHKADSSAIASKRFEIAFIARAIDLLQIGGKACIITPDGFFENPSYERFRKEVLELTTVTAIISLPKFAFAPYTKEKTYALFFERKANVKLQTAPIWMYIVDNDGYANSDKRFPTKRKTATNEWSHDEIASWIDDKGIEHPGALISHWLSFDDAATAGTSWVSEKGIHEKLRKAGFVSMADVTSSRFHNLLPEYYLRPYDPKYISRKELKAEVERVEKLIADMLV